MNNKLQLKKHIQQIELQIKKLDLNMSDSDVCVDLYNSLILKKAVFKKQLEESDKNIFIEKIKKIFPHKKKLICDYFNVFFIPIRDFNRIIYISRNVNSGI